MHPRVSLHQVAFMDESTAVFLDFCRQAGFQNAVLAVPKIDADGLEDARQAVRVGGLHIAALNQMFAVHPDLEADAGKAAAGLTEAVAIAETLGARSIYLLTGGRGSLSWEAAAARFAELVAPCTAAARTKGIDVLIENAPALYADIHIAHTLADTIRLAEAAEIGVCVELFACWAEADLAALFRRAMPRCGLVQVSDYVLGDRALPSRAVPGDGCIPLERLLGQVLDAGYQALFDIELIGPRIAAEGPEAAARRAGEQVSEMLMRLGA
jgi:sugar phosphate isomerase/epimerase